MIEFFLHIGEDGQLMNPKVVREKFSQLETGRWLVQMKRSNNRTIPMNSYLHGVLIPEFRKALNGVGYNEVKTDDQAKEIMKNMFLKTRVVNENTG